MSCVGLEPVDRVEITVVVDNVTDPLLVDQESVVRMMLRVLAFATRPATRKRAPGSVAPDRDDRNSRASR